MTDSRTRPSHDEGSRPAITEPDARHGLPGAWLGALVAMVALTLASRFRSGAWQRVKI